MAGYEDSYLGQIRRLVGQKKVIVTAARAVVRDSEGRILFVRRRDNGQWGMPGGSQELGESILDCLKREVEEECGIAVLSATPIAIYSSLSIRTAYDDPYQVFLVEFLIDRWAGFLVTETDETVDARFFAQSEPPDDLPDHYREALGDLRTYHGDLILR